MGEIKIKVLASLGLSLVFCYFGLAQKFAIGTVNTIKGTAFDPGSKTIFAIYSDSIRAFYAPDYNKSKVFPFTKPVADFPEVFRIVWSNTSINFVDNNGGAVFRFINDTLIQVDSSFEHRMQISSTLFERKDTIMRYGGYGFWSNRNFFTFFDEQTGNWEMVPPTGSNDFPEGTAEVQIVQNGDSIFTLGGGRLNFRNPLIGESYPHVWLFQMQQRRWDYMGKMEWENIEHNLRIQMPGKLLILPNRNLALLAEPSRNKISQYRINPDFHNLFIPKSPWENRLSNFYQDGVFYLLAIESESSNAAGIAGGNLVYEIVPETQFLSDFIDSDSLYYSTKKSAFDLSYLLLALALTGGCVIIWHFNRNKNKIVLKDSRLYWRNQSLSLNEEFSRMLMLLIKSGGEVSFIEIENLLSISEYSATQKQHLLKEKIAELNFRLKSFLKTEDTLISISRSSKDRRIKCLKLEVLRFKIGVA